MLALITFLLILGLKLPQPIATGLTSSPAVNDQVNQCPILSRLEKAGKLYEKGDSQLRQDEPKAALSILYQALKIVQGLNEPCAQQAEAVIRNRIGTAHFYLGQYQKARHFYQQALTIYEALDNYTGQASIYSNLGELYQQIGKYPKALEFHQRALEITNHQHLNDEQRGSLLNNFGVTHHSLGQYDQALEYYQQALEIHPDSQWQANIQTNMGNLYTQQGQYSKALKYYEKALEIAQAENNKFLQGRILTRLGSVYTQQQEYENALNLLHKALRIRREAMDRPGEGITVDDLGTVYRNIGESETALEYHQQALEIVRSNDLPERPEEGKILSNLGYTLMTMGRYAEATDKLFEAVNIWESLRPGLDDGNKVSLQELQTHTYEWLQEALVQQRQVEAALEVSERGRARAFVELMASGLKLSEIEGYQAPTPLTFKQIQQIARRQQATLVEYSYVNQQQTLYIWVIQPDGRLTFRQVDGPILSPNRRYSISRSQIYSYQRLIQPIEDQLPTNPNAHVIFIPHKDLFKLAFPALQDQQGQYLIHQHTILLSPSIQVLDLTQQTQEQLTQQGESLIIGNPQMPLIASSASGEPKQLPPLPGTEKEAKEIAQLLKTEAILGQQATKERVLQKMPHAKIIHFATHGLLHQLNHLGLEIPGALALTPTSDNGLLTAGEILKLQLNAELVVLSACHTGLGDITSDGVIGLSRAFMTAGIPSIIVSLSEIPDEPSAELMIEFYHQMLRTDDKAVALRQAMLKTMEDYPEPINWAAFLLMGQPT